MLMKFIKKALSMLTNKKQKKYTFYEYSWDDVLNMPPETVITVRWNSESYDAAPELKTAGEMQAMAKEYIDNQKHDYRIIATCYHKKSFPLVSLYYKDTKSLLSK